MNVDRSRFLLLTASLAAAACNQQQPKKAPDGDPTPVETSDGAKPPGSDPAGTSAGAGTSKAPSTPGTASTPGAGSGSSKGVRGAPAATDEDSNDAPSAVEEAL